MTGCARRNDPECQRLEHDIAELARTCHLRGRASPEQRGELARLTDKHARRHDEVCGVCDPWHLDTT